ncbi:glycosyltransferase family 39 protein [Candidatus Dojkabacteria bacterium]|uniref:Glycosyltransferase family 39 protein n=1 Tax=Candidatus Dojkabacteria bacterium TaxID=2099670 RepID=A0A847VD99_9BACT|nr:glycosyltransferase family 39 protein [Candidatus Dojkabacteria bacterium]
MQFKKILNSISFYRIALFFFFLVFFLESLFFALYIREAIFPDEGHHLRLSQLYSETYTNLKNSEESYHLGDIEHIPYLYHWIGGRILNVKKVIFPFVEDLFVLRVFSVILGVVNLYIAYQIVKRVTKEKLQHVLLIAMLSSTPMFSFISAGVSYDPLVFLFSFLSILLTLKLLERNSISLLLSLVITMLAGILTKKTFLPLVVVIIFFLIIKTFQERKEYLNIIKRSLKDKRELRHIIFLLLVTFFFLFLSLNLYLRNIIKYKNLIPSCTQVMQEEDCMKDPEFLRDLALQENAPPRAERLKPYWYIPHWVYLMINTTYAICGHKAVKLSYSQFIRFFMIIILGLIMFVRKYDVKNPKYNFLVILSLFYTFTLMFYVNYQSYLWRGVIGVALQGRYIFPVIVPIYICVIEGLLLFKNKYMRVTIFGVILFVFLYGNIPFFVRNLTADWFFENAGDIRTVLNVKDSLYIINHNIKRFLP